MIDLVIYAPNKAALRAFAVVRGLLETVDGELQKAKDFDYCWWAGSGNFMIAKGTYDGEGVQITSPSFAPSVIIESSKTLL
tara:strand:- start:273 stop:515 length:243 start_codon:yes stop_codon:yes gene_type:complete